MKNEFDTLVEKLGEQFEFKAKKYSKEKDIVESAMLVLNRKIPWYKPWQIFSHIKAMKRAILLLAGVSTRCLIELVNLQENQLTMMDIQKLFKSELGNKLDGRLDD